MWEASFSTSACKPARCSERAAAREKKLRNRACPVQLKVGERLACPAIAYGLPGMAVGEIRTVKVSPNLTYYERKQNPSLPANVALRYEIELLAVNDEWDTTVYKPENTEGQPG